MTEKKLESIELVPTWEGILPMLLLLLEEHQTAGQKFANEELRKMARAADKYNEMVKRT